MTNPKRILVIEDEHAVGRLVQVNLEQAGYACRWAPNGTVGLEMVASEPPDLIVLDVIMPGLDGFEVLSQLKADPETADIPVVMLTGKSDDSSVLQGWTEGVHCYITKPFDPQDLLTYVAHVLSDNEDPELTE